MSRVLQSSTARRATTLETVVAGFVALVFAFQILVVPLHLAWHVHVGADGFAGDTQHAHAAHNARGRHAEHEHEHPADAEDEDPQRDSHPVTDHVDQLAEVLPEAPCRVAFAIGSSAGWSVALDGPLAARWNGPEVRLRPPPPRDESPPRAPPVVS